MGPFVSCNEFDLYGSQLKAVVWGPPGGAAVAGQRLNLRRSNFFLCFCPSSVSEQTPRKAENSRFKWILSSLKGCSAFKHPFLSEEKHFEVSL